MKAYTDIEQSKKLSEILPLESADMCWTPFDEKWDAYLGAPNPDAIKKEIPCWSLVALLNILPSGKVLIHDKESCKYKCICNNIDTAFYCNPVDACYEMIIKLHELNLL